jgi:PAS domain S-box-containing protein
MNTEAMPHTPSPDDSAAWLQFIASNAEGMLANLPVVAFRISSSGELQNAIGAGLRRFGEGEECLSAYASALQETATRDAVQAALNGEQVRCLAEGIFAGEPFAFDTFLAFDHARGAGAIGFALDMTDSVKTARDLARSVRRWQDLAETSSDHVLLLDMQGRITYINRPTEDLDSSQVIGTNVQDWTMGESFQKFPERLATVLSTGEFLPYETIGYSPDDQPRWYAVRMGPYRENEKIIGVVMYISDVTSRKRAEQARLAAESRYRSLMDAAHDAILIIDAETGCVLEANAMAQTILGKSASELKGCEHHRLYGPAHAVRVKLLFQQCAKQGRGLITDVELIESRQHLLPVETSLRWTEIDGRRLVIAIARDVTEHKQAEQSLRHEESLLRDMLRLQERERRLMSYDIHDGFVQDVVGAHLALEGMTLHFQSLPAEVQAQVESVKRLLRKAIDEGRRLISELRPPVIDEQGILEAIRYLISEHQMRGGVEVEFEHEVAFERLSPLLEGNLFRIVQEALNNVWRHSRAEAVKIKLQQDGEQLRLTIRDNGVGFQPSDVPADRFGLRGMKERARLFGGHATISTTPGLGTEIAVELPIDMYLMDSSGG